jgi:hypothetical protein
MLIASWWVTRWMAGAAGPRVFFALLATGVCAGTIRGHLLFVEWSRPATIRVELRRLARWLRLLEVTFGLVSGASALAVGSDHPVAGTLFLAAAAIMTMSIFAMEPATTRSAFSSAPEPP